MSTTLRPTPTRLSSWFSRGLVGWAVLVAGLLGAESALGAEEQRAVMPSRFELCFVGPIDAASRQQIVQLLQARLTTQHWILTSSTEGSISAGFARLRNAEVDLALLLEAHGELWRVYVVEPRSRHGSTRETSGETQREISGAARDAAASEAVVSIAVSAVEAWATKVTEERVETAEPAKTSEPPRQEVRTPEAKDPAAPRVLETPSARASSTPRADSGDALKPASADATRLQWGLGVGADFGALSHVGSWSVGPLLTGHAFFSGTGSLGGEVRVHATHHLSQTIETDVGTFDWSRTLLGVNAGPSWWLTRRTTLGADVGLQWERATRSHAVAHDGVEGLPGRPHHRGAAQLTLIGTLFWAQDFGLRVGGGAQWWFGETRYIASNGDVLLGLPRLSSTASLSLLWRI